MGFVDAVKSFYRNYTKFDGRASRSEFWWVQLYITVVSLILIIPAFGLLVSMMAASEYGVPLKCLLSVCWD